MSIIQIAKAKRLRSTPYTSRIEQQGLKAYTIYNHMLLPAAFEVPMEESYFHLKKNVQVWDVAAERQVEISGEDAAELVQLMTCRDLSKSKDGRCYYCPIIDDNAGLINDPVVLRINKNKWWLSIADSDVILFAKGLAIGKNYNVNIIEPNVNIMAIQGPKSFALMEKVFGKSITDLKFFGFDYFEFRGCKHLIARSGWSKQGGYEVYVENTKSGLELYDYLFEIGKEFDVKPGCPHLIERIESALLSYGNDFDSNDNPLECGFDKYVNLDNDIEFLGKEKLKQIKSQGISKKIMGVKIDLNEINVSKAIDITINSKRVGELRSGVYSPTFNQVIGIAMIDKPFFEVDTKIEIMINNETKTGVLCNIPFV
jgi:dimethylsulfoniopropionate demethylase